MTTYLNVQTNLINVILCGHFTYWIHNIVIDLLNTGRHKVEFSEHVVIAKQIKIKNQHNIGFPIFKLPVSTTFV